MKFAVKNLWKLLFAAVCFLLPFFQFNFVKTGVFSGGNEYSVIFSSLSPLLAGGLTGIFFTRLYHQKQKEYRKLIPALPGFLIVFWMGSSLYPLPSAVYWKQFGLLSFFIQRRADFTEEYPLLHSSGLPLYVRPFLGYLSEFLLGFILILIVIGQYRSHKKQRSEREHFRFYWLLYLILPFLSGMTDLLCLTLSQYGSVLTENLPRVLLPLVSFGGSFLFSALFFLFQTESQGKKAGIVYILLGVLSFLFFGYFGMFFGRIPFSFQDNAFYQLLYSKYNSSALWFSPMCAGCLLGVGLRSILPGSSKL